MKCNKVSKINELNFNLKNEIFSFFEAKYIIYYASISKKFKYAVEKMKWFKLIKDNFDKLISESSLVYSEMNEIKNLFIEQGESEIAAFYICLYLFLVKYKNNSFIDIFEKSFGKYGKTRNL